MNDAALLDFNGDGKLDVAGCDDSGVVILLGNGDGTLSLSQSIPGPCAWITAADFNGDNKPDLAVGNPAGFGPVQNNQVIVYLGDGQGGIANTIVNDNVNFNSIDHNLCRLDGKAVAADFTGDKVTDIAITADCGSDASTTALIIGKRDGPGHFEFHKDQELGYDSEMRLRLVDVNQDGKTDIVAAGSGTGPHASSSSDLFQLVSHGDGTFAPIQIVAPGAASGAVLDLDGDGIKDAVAIVGTENVDETIVTYELQIYKGQPDGSYSKIQSSALGTGAFDMVWGDFDKDGRADVAMVRLQTDTTDVLLNRSSKSPQCPTGNLLTNLPICLVSSDTAGNVHFQANFLDNLQVRSMQIYVDNKLAFQTPDDLLNVSLPIPPGRHSIAIKAWDAVGAFATFEDFCNNSSPRAVQICSPATGVTLRSPVRVVASAATSLPFKSLQFYFDGKLIFQTTSKFYDGAIQMKSGIHNITIKGWDSNGAFSSSEVIQVQ